MTHDFKIPEDEFEDLIKRYCRDFTALEREGRFDPITGRDKEIMEVILILLQKGRKNAILLAPAGVGKTAMVVGLSQKIVSGQVPDYLKDARVIEVDLASMAAGTAGPAEFQGRFIPLCKAVAERYRAEGYPRIIMFLDEVHTIMPTVEGSAYRGLSEVLKPYLTVGDLHVIGATTLDEYRMYVKLDPAMDRRFQQVPLKVPTNEETIKILEALRPGYEKYHGLTISDECLEILVKLTAEHMPRRNNPDKSITMMDGACAWQVLYRPEEKQLLPEAIKSIISIEAKIHPEAL